MSKLSEISIKFSLIKGGPLFKDLLSDNNEEREVDYDPRPLVFVPLCYTPYTSTCICEIQNVRKC